MKKEVLIFGAQGALGKGITEVFLKKNYDKIYLLDFKIEAQNLPNNVEIIEYDDLSREESLIKVFKKITPGRDKTFFLYSTVGGFSGGPKIWETDETGWDKMFNLNLKTSFLIAKHFSLKVQESQAGSILFTAAYTSVNPEVGKAAYGSSKSGLVSLVETLALEGKEINLTANAIAPYIIDTPANREWGKEEDIKEWIKPEEIGELAHCIFSNFHFLSGNIFKLKTRLLRVN